MNPSPLNTTAIAPQRAPLGNADAAWDVASKASSSQESHALGNHREVPIAYTAALKSNAQALGSYRHDIAYTGALKSAQTLQGGHASNGKQLKPQFTGVEKVLAPVLFSTPVIGFFSWLNQANSMWPLVFQDLIGSSGRVYQDNKRNPHGGRESLIEELTTCIVWGGGISACKSLYDKFATRLTGGNVQFPKLDTALLPGYGIQGKGFLGKLLGKFAKPDDSLSAQVLKKEVITKFEKNKVLSTADAEHLRKLLQGAGKSSYIWSRMAKLFFCSTLPILVLATLLPKANQALTRMFVKKEKAAKAQKEQGVAANTAQPVSIPRTMIPSPQTRVSYPPQVPSATTPTGFNGFAPTPIASQAAPGQQLLLVAPRFKGLAQALDPVASVFLNNTVLNTLVFNDIPLETGRAITARNWDERYEKMFQGGMIVGTLFLLLPKVQQWTSRLMDKWFKTQTDITFKALHSLQKNPARLKGYKQLPKNKSDEELVNEIRDYFAKPNPEGKKLLFDLANESGHIPLTNNRIDITQRIDLNGVKKLDAFLGVLEKGGDKLQRKLTTTTGAKMGAFLFTTGIGWFLLSYFTPKMKQYITYKRTGKNQFPGIENL